MNRVDMMLNSIDENDSLAFMNFTRLHGKVKNKNLLIIIIEGDDDLKYYSSRFDGYIGEGRCVGMPANGKYNLIPLMRVLSDHPIYSMSKYCGIIDNDYDEQPQDYASNDLLYVTPCYSVENLYVSETVFKKVLKVEFGFCEFSNSEEKDTEEEYQKIVAIYREKMNEFLNVARSFNLWLKTNRLMAANGQYKKLPANDIKLEKLVTLNSNDLSVMVNFDPSDISSLYSDYSNSDLCSIKKAEADSYINSKNPVYFFRGKQNLDFFVKLLMVLKEDAGKKDAKRKFFPSKKKVIIRLDNPLSELSSHAETPECLIKFMISIKSMYFQEAG